MAGVPPDGQAVRLTEATSRVLKLYMCRACGWRSEAKPGEWKQTGRCPQCKPKGRELSYVRFDEREWPAVKKMLLWLDEEVQSQGRAFRQPNTQT